MFFYFSINTIFITLSLVLLDMDPIMLALFVGAVEYTNCISSGSETS